METDLAQSNVISITPAAISSGPDIQAAPKPADAGGAAGGLTQAEQKSNSMYGTIPAVPVLEAVEGIRFDFNHGIRILFPNTPKIYHVTFTDLDTGIILYSNDTEPGALITSVKKFYTRFRLIIHHPGNETPIFTYDMDLRDRQVMLQLPAVTLGDAIGWFSYAERFQQKHQCRLICVMAAELAGLVKKQYPDITFITKEETGKYRPYASYFLGLFFQGDTENQPVDFRFAGLHRTAGYILGLRGCELDDLPPRLDLSAPRQIKEPFVCIAAQSSSQAKYWNNPRGWLTVVDFLRKHGYRVLCIDKEKVHGTGLSWNFIPYGAEDFTGNLPLQERVNLLKDADFFIGLSSGLSWLAWSCGVPVVLISGFTHPRNEFQTPYRVINYHACNSCWNDMRLDFDHFDFLWCPRHKNTEKQFECSRLISAEQVINTIRRIPAFQEMERTGGRAASDADKSPRRKCGR